MENPVPGGPKRLPLSYYIVYTRHKGSSLRNRTSEVGRTESLPSDYFRDVL